MTYGKWKGQIEKEKEQQSSFFRTRELMPSGPVAESKSCKVVRCKNTHNSGAVGYDWEGWVQRKRDWGHKMLKQHRIETFSLVTSKVGCGAIWSEGKVGRGAYTRDWFDKVSPAFKEERQVWKFILEIGQMLFSGSPESRHTLVARFVEWPEVAFSQIWGCLLPGGECNLF